MTSADDPVLTSWLTGIVVIKKSWRSFRRARRPTADIALSDVMRSIPLKLAGNDGKISSTNFATFPPTGIGANVVDARDVPFG